MDQIANCQRCVPQWGPNAMGTLPSLLFLLGCCRQYAGKPSRPKRPHIVLFIADDLGWNDVSFHGSKQIPTPNIDALARDGIILNQYYVQHICSPSRSSLMTGKYTIQTGFQHDLIEGAAPWGLSLKEKILPQYLKDLQYSTHAIGKWHLGYFKKEYLPSERGFDTFFGYYNGVEDYFTHESIDKYMIGLDLHYNGKTVWQYNGTYGPDLFTDKAKEVIFAHDQTKPLFLYFAQQSPHSGNFDSRPLQSPEKYVKPLVGINDEKRRTFGGIVSSMEHSVGEIFEALEISRMLEDTIFIFTTDNGGATQDMHSSGSNWPLKGSKYTLWEGGLRGVAFMWSHFLRKNCGIYNGLMHISDWLPTILSAVGGPEALNMLPNYIAGFDQWSSIVHGFTSPRAEILLNIDDIDEIEGIRKGRYKLVKGSYQNRKHDRWYDEEGRPFNITYSLRSIFEKELYRENYFNFLRSSKVAEILQRKYGKPPFLASSCLSQECIDDLELKCGIPPAAPNCDATKEYCLYDLVKDPCEFYNLANVLPDVTEELIQAIQKYRPFAIPPKDLPRDPAADPKFHGNVWVPWK